MTGKLGAAELALKAGQAGRLLPAGLEDFFIGIGRPKRQGQPDPTPYPRPAEAGAIEMATVFETLDPPPAPPWDTAPITDASVLEALRREAL